MKTYRDLSYSNLSLRFAQHHNDDLVRKTYQFWKTGWEDTFRSLGVIKKQSLLADDFVYRNAHVLTYMGKPIAIYLGDLLSINEMTLNLGYFQMYNTKSINHIRERFKSVYTLSYFLIDAEWRRDATDVPIGDILFGIAVKNYVESKACAFLSCVRDNRGVNKIFSRFGAVTIDRGAEFNVDVSYMYLDSDLHRPHEDAGVMNAIEFLWSHKQSHKESVNEQRTVERKLRSVNQSL